MWKEKQEIGMFLEKGQQLRNACGLQIVEVRWTDSSLELPKDTSLADFSLGPQTWNFWIPEP